MKIPERVVRRMPDDGNRHRDLVLDVTVGRTLHVMDVRVGDTSVDFLTNILVSNLRLLMRLLSTASKVALLVH